MVLCYINFLEINLKRKKGETKIAIQVFEYGSFELFIESTTTSTESYQSSSNYSTLFTTLKTIENISSSSSSSSSSSQSTSTSTELSNSKCDTSIFIDTTYQVFRNIFFIQKIEIKY